MPSDEDAFRALKRRHQALVREWKRKHGPCIVCGEREGDKADHLPPKVLFPPALRTPKTEFFTFPVCEQCNGESSDQDFLFSVLLSISLNQESTLMGQEPTDPELRALYHQTEKHLSDSKKSQRRIRLLQPYVGTDAQTGLPAINITAIPVHKTLTKIVKSIYWLNTDGDLLQSYKPGWWILPGVDPSKPKFVSLHLKTSHAELHWGGAFISHFNFGHPDNGVGGFIYSSLHFYTKRSVNMGMSWIAVASPSKTIVDGKSLYDHCTERFGPATFHP